MPTIQLKNKLNFSLRYNLFMAPSGYMKAYFYKSPYPPYIRAPLSIICNNACEFLDQLCDCVDLGF